MSGLATAITTGITAFSATNIDDLAILMLFFTQVNATFHRRHIVVGQYLGFGALVIASLPSFFGSLIVPRSWIGLLGIMPIAMGLNHLLQGEEDSSEPEAEIEQSENLTASFLSPQTYGVAAVTFANGGDNIGVYVPLFASSDLGSLLVILGVFFLLIGAWCYIAYQLTRLRAIADVLTNFVNALVPVVLIGLGVFIIWESGASTRIALAASCLCLMTLLERSSART